VASILRNQFLFIRSSSSEIEQFLVPPQCILDVLDSLCVPAQRSVERVPTGIPANHDQFKLELFQLASVHAAGTQPQPSNATAISPNPSITANQRRATKMVCCLHTKATWYIFCLERTWRVERTRFSPTDLLVAWCVQ
jgi:hypothetical protein